MSNQLLQLTLYSMLLRLPLQCAAVKVKGRGTHDMLLRTSAIAALLFSALAFLVTRLQKRGVLRSLSKRSAKLVADRDSL